MIGISLKSDILPILRIGAKTVHIPFHTTWQHEEVRPEEHTNDHLTLSTISDILKYLK